MSKVKKDKNMKHGLKNKMDKKQHLLVKNLLNSLHAEKFNVL